MLPLLPRFLPRQFGIVPPYMYNKRNTEKAYYEYCYDEIIIPEELCTVHYKAAIQKRNRWMVDRADYLTAYLFRDFGGAYEAVKYAKRQGKSKINLAEQGHHFWYPRSFPII